MSDSVVSKRYVLIRGPSSEHWNSVSNSSEQVQDGPERHSGEAELTRGFQT